MARLNAATRAAIEDVIRLYCHAIDRRRWDLMGDCFRDGATYSFGPIQGSWRDFVDSARQMIDPLPMTHHQLGQTSHALTDSQVRTETYFTATHRVPANAPADAVFDGRGHDYHAVIGGRYIDTFVHADGCWRIAHRIGIIDSRYDIVLPGAGALMLGVGDPAAALDFGTVGSDTL